jgi:hypothetical protein
MYILVTFTADNYGILIGVFTAFLSFDYSMHIKKLICIAVAELAFACHMFFGFFID